MDQTDNSAQWPTPSDDLSSSGMLGVLRVLRLSVLTVVIGVTVLFVGLCGGHFLDRHNTAYAAEVALLDWRDFRDVSRAKDRLSWELDKARVGTSVKADSCRFIEDTRGNRVECAWTPEVVIPFSGFSFPLAFRTKAEFGEDGYLKWHFFGVE